ncbi:LysR substrate-binding domain-containing protein, partial [Erwinia amylovora]|uniref:LysR substrate-binding domain-containing protein n=1 Tax=Erwinia amylovora TaxID=552 RepID=UPI0020BD98FC
HTISLPFRKEKQKKDIEVRSRFRAKNSIALLNSAVAETGIAYLTSYIAGEAVESGKLVRLLPEWEMDIYKSYVLIKCDSFVSPRVRLCLEELQREL